MALLDHAGYFVSGRFGSNQTPATYSGHLGQNRIHEIDLNGA